MLHASWIYFVVISAEILLSNYQHKKFYTWKVTVTNFSFSLLNGSLDLLIRGACFVVLNICYQFSFAIGLSASIYWILLFILTDFLLYWMHRIEHHCRIFWAVHVTHHSAEEMNLSVGFRASVFQPVYRFLFFIPLAFCGFQPIDILFMYSIIQFWTVLIHTRYTGRMPLFDFIFVTPSHHRVHHASNALYLDRNMGAVLIIWDRIFKSFQREKPASSYEPIRYGLVSPPQKTDLIHLIFHEWIAMKKDLSGKALRWTERLYYLFGPPGWKPDKKGRTSRMMRKELEEKILQK